MTTNNSLVETALIDEKIQMVMRQTDYNEEIARVKLLEHDFDEIATIKSYLGVPEKKSKHITSINQEIYKQLRNKLDSNMQEYKVRAEKGEAKKLY
jgi:endonuclease III